MASALIVLLVLVGLAALWLDRAGLRARPGTAADRYRTSPFGRTDADTFRHDRERQYAELRALRGYRQDPPLFG